MTDVLKKAIDANPIKQGAAFVIYPNATASLFDDDFAYQPVVSGVNGVDVNGYLDGKFDNVDYYV